MKLHVNFRGIVESNLDIILGNGNVIKLDFRLYKWQAHRGTFTIVSGVEIQSVLPVQKR